MLQDHRRGNFKEVDMSRKAGIRAGWVAGAFAMLAAVAATAAVAAGGAVPSLLAPNHKHVNRGHIGLTINVPLKTAKHGVFIVINNHRSLDKLGHLKLCKTSRCDIVAPKHKNGTKFKYVSPFTFPGFWAVTPGKYYWQANYFTVGDTANYYSKIGWFWVK
jgi:hypothetical protein